MFGLHSVRRFGWSGIGNRWSRPLYRNRDIQSNKFSLFPSRVLIDSNGWRHWPGSSKTENEERNNNKRMNQKPNNPNSLFSREDWLLVGAAGTIALLGFLVDSDFFSKSEIDWDTFVTNYLATGNVKKLVVVNNDIVRVYLNNEKEFNQKFFFRIANVETFEKTLDEFQDSLSIPVADRIPVSYRKKHSLFAEVAKIMPTVLLLIVAGRLIFKSLGSITNRGGRGGIFGIGKSNAKLFNKQDKVTISFNDVAGMPEAKVEVQEFVDFLKNPKKYEILGARIPKGALLVGPPGTGKTLLAKAVAGESNVPFLSTSGSDFIEMFVGVGPARARDLFQTARENAPCIVFIDEIDAIGRARGKGGFYSGNDERENTLNQILVEMDGFESSSGVIVLAGTNRPDILDRALLRPGRFDRQIAIDKPDIKARKEIFLVHLKPLKLEDATKVDEYAVALSELTPGFSGADISNVCNEAALIAARRNAETVTLQDLNNAIDRVVAGMEKKNKILSPKEKKTVAFHEAGHALLGWFLEHANPVLKVSIVPRVGDALGYTQYLPGDQYLLRQDKLNDMMCVALGGRVAEEVVFGSITTGARDDLDRVTQLAYSQVKIYGMSEVIGPLSFPNKEATLAPYSDDTARMMDVEARSLVQSAYDRAKQIITEKRELLDNLAHSLMEKEVVNAEDLTKIFGPRPFKSQRSV